MVANIKSLPIHIKYAVLIVMRERLNAMLNNR